MLFNSDGTVLYVMGQTGDDINVYTLDPVAGFFGIGTFLENLSALSLNSTYYFRAYAANLYGTSTGEILSFTTDNIPTVTTGAASAVVATSSTLNGNITNTGGENAGVRGFAYATSSGLTTNVSTTTENGSFGTGAFTGSAESLTGNTTYYARAYATNPYGTAFGSIVNFSTPPGIPGTADFDAVTQTTLTVFWTAPTGGATSYKLERCDGEACSDFEQLAAGITNFEDPNFYYEDSSLLAGTSYSYRVRGTNATGDGLYSTVAATTTLTGPPIVTSEAATSVGTNEATVNANLTTTGGYTGEGTAHGFVWGTGASLAGGDTATSSLGTYSATGPFDLLLSSLSHSTSYYFRAYATNPVSTVWGDILSFMTERNFGGGGDIGGDAPPGDGIVGGGDEGGGEDIGDPPPGGGGGTGGGGSGGGGDL
jgi:hypothetical protein